MKPRKLKYMLLREEYKETPQYRAGRLLQAILDKIAVWFKTGAFSKQNVKCTYLESGDTDSGLQNTVTARFHDQKNYFTLAVTAMTEDMINGTPEKVHVKLKRYDAQQAELLNEVSDDVDPAQITEDYLIKMVGSATEAKDLEDATAKKEQAPAEPAQGDKPAQGEPSAEETMQDMPPA